MEKVRTAVHIGGKEYVIAGYDSEEHVRRIAEIVDRQMRELWLQTKLQPTQLAVLAAMNMADEALKSNEEVRRLKKELDETRHMMEKMAGGVSEEKHDDTQY